jgi:ketosteroid isomerase-like protein
MQPSPAVADALRTFFAKNASGDVSTFDEVVTEDEGVLAIGSSVLEWFAGQAAVRGAYGLEGFQIDPGEIAAWENGDSGWAAAKPVFSIPGGPSLRLRFTAVFVREDGAWKLAHLHGSYPVPDETATAHPEWWDAPAEA